MINTISTLLKVRGIGASKYESSEFVVLSLNISDKNNLGDLVNTSLQYEIHLIEGLYANLLIGNNIIFPEAMVINLGKKTVLIGTCGVTIYVNTKQCGQFLTKKLLTSQESVIFPCLKAMIFLGKPPLLNDRDFLF